MPATSHMLETVTIAGRRIDIRTTPRSRTPWLVGISLLFVCAGNAAAQTPAPLGPEAPASESEVNALREELRKQGEAADARINAQATTLYQLKSALDEEHQARIDAEAAARKA